MWTQVCSRWLLRTHWHTCVHTCAPFDAQVYTFLHHVTQSCAHMYTFVLIVVLHTCAAKCTLPCTNVHKCASACVHLCTQTPTFVLKDAHSHLVRKCTLMHIGAHMCILLCTRWHKGAYQGSFVHMIVHVSVHSCTNVLHLSVHWQAPECTFVHKIFHKRAPKSKFGSACVLTCALLCTDVQHNYVHICAQMCTCMCTCVIVDVHMCSLVYFGAVARAHFCKRVHSGARRNCAHSSRQPTHWCTNVHICVHVCAHLCINVQFRAMCTLVHKCARYTFAMIEHLKEEPCPAFGAITSKE
jgi:hypothetical protein